MSTLQEEISRRRTFAIISHPDAGKTTLTEKFLLYGGAIAQAGEVKGKRAKAATSDWMEIENSAGSPSPPPSCSSSMGASASTFWTPPATRTFRGHLSHPYGGGQRGDGD